MKNIQTLVKLSSWRTQIIDDIWPKPGWSSTKFKKFTYPKKKQETKAKAQENKQIAKFTVWILDQILQIYCLEGMIVTRICYDTIPK